MLRIRIVDGDHRKPEHAILSHAAQAGHAGRGLLGSAPNFRQLIFSIGVQGRDQIRAVVHRDLRPVIQRRGHVFVIGRVVLTFDGKDGNLMKPHQSRRNVVLRAQRV